MGMPSRILQALLAGAVIGASTLPSVAQEYPAKPVRIMYPNTPGSTGDISVRAITEKLAARFGQPFVVENRPGANSMLAATAVHGATNDLRISSLPDVPTIVELGYPNFKLFTTSSFWTRSGVPARAQERMIAAMKEIAAMPDIVARARTAGGSPLVADAAEIKRRVVEEARLYADAAKAINYVPE